MSDKIYTPTELEKWKFSVRVKESPQQTTVSRCSFSTSAGRVTCDDYQVDKIEIDQNIDAKKYYVFASQYDFQIFSTMESVENNGRGSVQYGKCEVVAP